MSARASAAKGFSLIELVVAIGLLGVVSTIAVGMFVRMSDLWTDMEAQVEMNDRAEYALARIEEDLTELVSPRTAGAPLVVTDAVHQDDRYFWAIDLADDAITLPTRVLQREDGIRRWVEVAYAVDRSTWTLMRSATAPGGASDAAPQPMIAATGVVQFNVSCRDRDGAWRTAWDEPEPPEAVRVSLVMMNPGRPWQQIARTAVYRVRVR